MSRPSKAAACRRSAVCFAGVAGMAAGILWAMPARSAATWDLVHGDAANTGLADVFTQPAVTPSATVTNLGVFAPGAGPVIGPDGTAYLGDEQGVLWALHANGSVAWQTKLGPGQSIQASPAVDTDGSVYVLGEHTYTADPNDKATRRTDSTLFHVAPTGQILWATQFPEHFSNLPEAASRGSTNAAPNIWRSGAQAAVIVPAAYKVLGGNWELDVLAFPPDGGAPLTQSVSVQVQTVTGGDGLLSAIFCAVTLCFLPQFHPTQVPSDPNDLLPVNVTAPQSGVGIFTFAGGGLPWVVVSDLWQQTVGYTFSPTSGFKEMFRTTDAGRAHAASPLMLPDGHSVTAAADASGGSVQSGHIVFTGPNGTALP
ncbi:MAG: PQQ-like beta-propeller repeat protein, partial [Acetobacteraceae bacterium]|nr:PQQ-like beta-propeller repeat protein [Acetobacteraceae bacterium]